MKDELVPMLAIVLIFGLPIGGWIALRAMQHRERMEMIRRGMHPGPPGWQQQWQGPAAGTQGQPPGSCWTPWSPQRQLRRGITTTFIGLALFIGLSFIGYRDGGWTPGPWLLGGLIPMFVGVATVIGALLSGAELPAVRTGFAAPPQQQPPAAGPYTYRPPGDQQELPRTKPPQQL